MTTNQRTSEDTAVADAAQYLPVGLSVRDLDVDPLEGCLQLAAVVRPDAAAELTGVTDAQQLAHEVHL